LTVPEVTHMKIYVAYRYSGNTLETLTNIGKATDAGIELAKKGHYPFIPHLDCQVAIQCKGCLPLDYYYKASMAFLRVCDAILILDKSDLNTSEGVTKEFAWAKSVGVPIYFTLEEIPNV